MKTGLYHLQVNIAPENLGFYRELMAFLGWDTLYETEELLGVGGSNGVSLWFIAASNGAKNDYDGPGMNHLGVGAESVADVDAVVAYLGERGIPALFETPRHRPEFATGEDSTYYQVMFETPDRVLVEIVYTGPK